MLINYYISEDGNRLPTSELMKILKEKFSIIIIYILKKFYEKRFIWMYSVQVTQHGYSFVQF